MNEFITQDVVNIVSSVGFPILVAWYFITKMQKTLEIVIQSVNNNTTTIKLLVQKLGGKENEL